MGTSLLPMAESLRGAVELFAASALSATGPRRLSIVALWEVFIHEYRTGRYISMQTLVVHDSWEEAIPDTHRDPYEGADREEFGSEISGEPHDRL